MINLYQTLLIIGILIVSVYLIFITPFDFMKFADKRKNCKKQRFGPGSSIFLFIAGNLMHLLFTYLLFNFKFEVSPVYFAVILGMNLLFIPFFYTIIYSLSLGFMILLFADNSFEENQRHDYQSDEELPSVTVIIPCRNEPVEVLKLTVTSVMNLIYPDSKISYIVVDNSDRSNPHYAACKEYVESLVHAPRKIEFLHRDGTEGYKAANLDLALQRVESDLVFFCDVDSSVLPNMLISSVHDFVLDEKLGLLQLYNVPTNDNMGQMSKSSCWHLAVWKFRELSRGLFGGWVFFQGHNALWRTSVLKQIKPMSEKLWGEEILIEDALMSVKSSRLGYYGASKEFRSGFWVPCSLKEIRSMWTRWTYGSMQIGFFALSMFFTKDRRKLTVHEYTDLVYHLLSNVAAAMTPVMVLLFLPLSMYVSNYISIFLSLFFLVESLFPILFFLTKKELRNTFGPGQNILSFLSSLFILHQYNVWCRFIAIFRFVTRKRQGWIPTGKSNEDNELSWFSVIKNHVFALLFSLVILSFFVKDMITGQLGGTDFLVRFPMLLLSFGIILSIILYGKAKMEHSEDMDNSATILKVQLDSAPVDEPVVSYKTDEQQVVK